MKFPRDGFGPGENQSQNVMPVSCLTKEQLVLFHNLSPNSHVFLFVPYKPDPKRIEIHGKTPWALDIKVLFLFLKSMTGTL